MLHLHGPVVGPEPDSLGELCELVLGLPRLDRQVSMGVLQGGQGRPLERLGLAAQAFGATEGWH